MNTNEHKFDETTSRDAFATEEIYSSETAFGTSITQTTI
jgi:hypothetical protein